MQISRESGATIVDMHGNEKPDVITRYGYIDKQGNEVVPIELDSAEDFHDGIARIHKQAWRFIYKNKNQIFRWGRGFYDENGWFYDGLARAKERRGKWGFVNKYDTVAVPFIYDRVFDFYEGLAGVQRNGKWGYIDIHGNEVVPVIYDGLDWAKRFWDGVTFVKLNGKYGFISITNNLND